jgi:hypothetical protein
LGGKTVGNKLFVWRSGSIDASGRLLVASEDST